MSQYDQLKLLYNQLINLTEEENKLVEAKAYQEIDSMLVYKAKLIRRVVVLKNMIEFTPHEAEEFSQIEQKYKQNEERNIQKFSKIKDELGLKLKNTQKNINLKSAYAKEKKERQGSLLDYTE